ncbi:hypothetical protein GCM10027034_32900 [Ramlibacter solisilvae]|uniref:3-phosphoglycerate kinase n=1 Tax=Ramlibacter tataouinensis TaxID=94132 RepID=A0A127JXM9_9BURK|nr:hypothetical protein [Ramlibacter tataouinensis]AMO22812.1 hypothetical protein UC35_07820 [Ramlibacter tataouinensis]
MRLVLIVATLMLPAYAMAGKLDLKQDLSGLDLTVAPVPADNPDAIKITNNTAKAVRCSGSFTGADAGPPRSVTIQPGKSATVRVPGTYTDMPRSADLKCAEYVKKAAKK